MKKSGTAKASIGKITFGARKRGKGQKSYGPKVSRPKKYRGQGR